jgi:hypothetical protein
MSEKTSVDLILGPLLASDQSELRQMPKTVARTYISLQQTQETLFEKNPFENVFLKSFGSRVSQLPTGLVLELWKTFLYHLDADVRPDAKTPKALNMICLTDPLLSTFLNHACIVEQSLPQRTAEKIVEMATKTQSLLTPLSGSLPLVQSSLFELSLMLKNCRQIDLSEVNDALVTSGGKLLKRKFDSLTEESEKGSKKSKTKLGYKDILPENLTYLAAVVDELSDKDIMGAAKMLLKRENLLSQCSKTVAEDLRLQVSVLLNFIVFFYSGAGAKNNVCP